jgi:hypothetical protein
MAREMYQFIAQQLEGGGEVVSDAGHVYQLPPSLKVHSLRLWETSSSWAEVVGD